MDLNKLKTANELQARIKSLSLLKELINSTQESKVLNVEISLRLFETCAQMTDPVPLIGNYSSLNMLKEDSLYIVDAIEMRMKQLEKEFKDL